MPRLAGLPYTRRRASIRLARRLLVRVSLKRPIRRMLSATRSFAKSWAAKILLVILALSFVVFGVQSDVFSNVGSTAVVQAGHRKVSPNDFKRQFDAYRDQLGQQTGQPVPQEALIERGVHTQMLAEMAQSEGFFAWAWKTGIRPGKALVIEKVREIPAFFDQVTGRFDPAAYRSRLAEANLTEPRFEQSLRDEIAGNHFAAALVAGTRAPRIYGALEAAYVLENRDGRWFTVDAAVVGPTPNPTDAQLTAFLNENAERLRRPELRVLSVALFTPGEAGREVTVTEEQIRQRFEFRRASLTTPEARTFVTLTAPNAAAAARIAEALRAGQDPAAVGRANGGVEPVRYDAKPQSAVADAAVGRAVFAMQPGQVSNPVQGSLGSTVIQLISVTPGRAANLEDVRGEIETELKAAGARARVYAMVEAYDKAREEGADLAAAAARSGARVIQLPPLNAEGALPNGQRINAPPQVFQTAFALPRGGESDVVDAGGGSYFAVRVNEIIPAATPSLNELRAPLTQAWIQRETGRRLQARAEELAARVRRGEAIEAVAASVGAPLTVRTAATRQSPQAAQQGGEPAIIQGLFGPGRGQTFVQPISQTSFVVGRVDAVHAPAPVLAASIAEQSRVRMGGALFNELIENARRAAGEIVRVRTWPERAAAALGLDPEAAPAAPAKK